MWVYGRGGMRRKRRVGEGESEGMYSQFQGGGRRGLGGRWLIMSPPDGAEANQ